MDCEGVGIAISVVSSGRRISLMRQGTRELFPPLGMLVFCLLIVYCFWHLPLFGLVCVLFVSTAGALLVITI